jgi:ribonuclease J
MRARIHRGAAQIGGSCVELEHDGARLVIDLGLPLGTDTDVAQPLPNVPGLTSSADNLLGVIISQNHPDHDGLLGQLSDSVQVFASLTGRRMDAAASRFTSELFDERIVRGLHDRVPIRLGPFSVTPLLVDHSAFEAFALLVEAGGRRLLYSGDLRAHGRKPSTWRRLIEDPPARVHVLLLEGTRLGRPSERNVTEREVEDQIATLARTTSGLVLACYSGQNIDRLVSVYKAAQRAGRLLILDLYGAAIAAATRCPTIPQAHWERVRVYVPQGQRRRIIETRAFSEIEAIATHRIFLEELRALAPQAVMTMRGSMTREIERSDCLSGAATIWSMWPGYLKRPSGYRMRDWLAGQEVPLQVIHASGHASVADLQTLAAAVAADQVVPIHTANPERYTDLFERVTIRGNGEWWRV